MAAHVTRLRHGRVSLALHALRPGEGPALLLLHALHSEARAWPLAAIAWPGPVHALDFCGHGSSDRVLGGSYTPELLVGDADAALAHLGSAHLAGAGLGAWVALLLAGARPAAVPAALLLPGVGLAGGGAVPDPDAAPGAALELRSDAAQGPGTSPSEHDPFLQLLDQDVRPTDYAAQFAARARRLLFAEDDGVRPPWWQAAAESATGERVSACDLGVALARLRART